MLFLRLLPKYNCVTCSSARVGGTAGLKMADQAEPGEAGGRSAVASYVATLSADLASMARRTGLDTLGYLLEMVRLEAESTIRHNGRR